MLLTPEQLKDRSWLTKPGFLIYPYVPAKSKIVLLHGPGGVGKSALIWSMQNALETGEPFLGVPTTKAKTLLISTDMNLYELDLRWGEKFKPLFHVEVTQPFDCTSPTFPNTKVYKRCADFVAANGVGAVFVDTIGKVHLRDARTEDTVALVYDALLKWFPGVTVVGNFHNRKAMRDPYGNELITEDDFRGSRKWADDAVSQLHMRKHPGVEYRSQLFHVKSQVSLKAEPLDLYIDIHGRVELWSTSRAEAVINKYAEVVKSHPDVTSTSVLIESVKAKFTVSESTAYRWRAMYLESLKKKAKMG